MVVVDVVSGPGAFSVRGLPAGTYNIKYSVTGDVDHDLAPQTIGTGQILRTSIPAVGVITVYRDDTIIPANTPAQASTQTATPILPPTTTGTPTAPMPACIGDCNDSGDVTVDELLSLVNIALNNALASECPAGDANHDGRITIDEVLTAVNSALNGCP